jgi:hypothetical protein
VKRLGVLQDEDICGHIKYIGLKHSNIHDCPQTNPEAARLLADAFS